MDKKAKKRQSPRLYSAPPKSAAPPLLALSEPCLPLENRPLLEHLEKRLPDQLGMHHLLLEQVLQE